MEETLLDTDILSEILKGKNRQVIEVAGRYLNEYPRFTFSAITYYEVLRGFLAKNAFRSLDKFLKLSEDSEVLSITIPILKRAASLWAEAVQNGYARNDADLIIAATALESHCVLGTGNSSHFAWIQGLNAVDWRFISPL